MHEPETAQPPLPLSGAFDFRDENGVRLPHYNHGGAAFAVYKQPELAAYALGQAGEFARLLWGEPALEGVAPLVKTVDGLELAGFETLQVALGLAGYGGLLKLALLFFW